MSARHLQATSGRPINYPPPRRLSEELTELSEALKHSEINVRDLMERLAGRVYTLLLVLISLPFCQPIALPGLSMPFGLIIALLGLRFAFRQRPWLPQRILARRIPPKILPAILRAGSRVLRILEKALRPRLSWIYELRVTQFLCGAVICFCGILLLLPLPIPLTNLFPALTVILIAAAVSERDGLMLGVAAGMFALTIIFFLAVFFSGAEIAAWLREHLGSLFDPKETGMPLIDSLDDP